jgi:hypothetical protein
MRQKNGDLLWVFGLLLRLPMHLWLMHLAKTQKRNYRSYPPLRYSLFFREF